MEWLNPDTWIISDTHFLHENIVKLVGRPENHNEIMIENWNNLVQPEDIVLHLGDVVFTNSQNREEAARFLRNLPGKKYLIKGNHDKENAWFYKESGFEVIKYNTYIYEYDFQGITKRVKNNYIWYWNGSQKILISHYPDVDNVNRWDINIHGHCHSNAYHASVPENKHYINLSVEMTDYKPIKLRDALQRENSRKLQGINQFPM